MNSQEKRRRFVITGIIQHGVTRLPLPGLTVKAFDADSLAEDDYLGSGVSDSVGRFAILYRETDSVKDILDTFIEGGPDPTKVPNHQKNDPARYENETSGAARQSKSKMLAAILTRLPIAATTAPRLVATFSFSPPSFIRI